MSSPAIVEPTPRYRVKEATEGGFVIGYMVVDMMNPDGAPLSQHWTHTDAVMAAESANVDEIDTLDDEQQTRCHECKQWFPDSQLRPANDSPEGPWGWGVCPECYARSRACDEMHALADAVETLERLAATPAPGKETRDDLEGVGTKQARTGATPSEPTRSAA